MVTSSFHGSYPLTSTRTPSRLSLLIRFALPMGRCATLCPSFASLVHVSYVTLLYALFPVILSEFQRIFSILISPIVFQ